jgi:hypothetical protein
MKVSAGRERRVKRESRKQYFEALSDRNGLSLSVSMIFGIISGQSENSAASFPNKNCGMTNSFVNWFSDVKVIRLNTLPRRVI